MGHPLVRAVAVSALLSVSAFSGHSQAKTAAKASPSCPDDDSGLKLPAGFCATLFADEIGHARHMVVAPSGVVYVNTWSGPYFRQPPHDGGFLVALQDRSGTGRADVIERFGETVESGGTGGTGIGIYEDWLYAEINDRIVRYSLPTGSIVPQGPPETVVSGLPLGGDHPMHPFVIDRDGFIYVDVASATNSCQLENRTLESPGANPCTELETRGGIWRYDGNRTNQRFSPAERFATGIRNAEGFAIDAAGNILAMQHGRDQLHANWPDIYEADQEATLPSEELLLLKEGGDYGWPECYYDPYVEKLILAPEYGGDGKKTGVCANKVPPVAAFPAHWAPNAMALYDKEGFPAHYRKGVFIAFHGSWDRAPYEQGGYNVVFQALAGVRARGNCEIFADGFAGAVKSIERAAYRPSGVAVGPDGSLYISDDQHGRIYRVVYRGGPAGPAEYTPCPSNTAPAGPVVVAAAKPPEGTHPDAGAAAMTVPVPEGATREMVALGSRIYHGQVGGSACTGCHGDSGEGSSLGPDLTDEKWLWSDGSFAGIVKTTTEGVADPREYRSPMPPVRGQLTPSQISAVAAYVWGLSRTATSAHPAP
jgi:glucose/arabinose dehydrogenase/mono/diheme cytochrome c family protein